MDGLSIKRSFFHYVSLNVMGMIGISCYILADTFFVARGVGTNGLAALNLAIPIYSLIHGTGLMIGMGGATRFAISKAKTVFTQALYGTAFAACLFVLIGAFLSQTMALALGADFDTLSHATVYLKTILLFSPLFLLNNVVICFVRNDGNPKLSMIAMLTGSLSNVLLDYIFIFPLQMGMFGAAFATGLAPLISLLILSSHFLKQKNTIKVQRQGPKPRACLDMLSLGISALITELSSGVVILVFNTILLRLSGNTGVAAYGIIANIALVVISIFTGIAQGMQPLVSHYVRTEQGQSMQKVLRYGVLTAICVAIAAYLVCALLADPIVAAFNKDNNQTLAALAIQGMRLYFTSFAFVGFNILCASYFGAMDRPKHAFSISLLRGFLIIIPMALLLAAIWGTTGVWLSMTCTEFLVLLVSVCLLKRLFQLRYEKLNAAHAPGLLPLWSDPAVIAYTNIPAPCHLTETQEKIEALRPFDVFVVYEGIILIGIVGAPCIEAASKDYGLFYHFRQSSWGKGYATRATAWLLSYMKKKVPGIRLHADVAAANPASEKILRHFGFRLIAQDNAFERNGVFHEIHHYILD